MANEEIILQIFFVTLGMVAFSLALNRILGLRKEKMQAFREKLMNMQERIKTAQALGDARLIQEIQMESMKLLNDMMKKQFIPMCIKCGIFLGILAILGFVFSRYESGLLPFPILFFGDGWFALYFLFSIGLSLLMFGLHKLYRKITGKEDKRKSFTKELMSLFPRGPRGLGSPLQFAPPYVQQSQNKPTAQQQQLEEKSEIKSPDKKETWKDRIER